MKDISIIRLSTFLHKLSLKKREKKLVAKLSPFSSALRPLLNFPPLNFASETENVLKSCGDIMAGQPTFFIHIYIKNLAV